MNSCTLADQICEACNGQDQLLSIEEIEISLTELDGSWAVEDHELKRRFTFKGFAKAVYLTNLCVWLADRNGHHPELALGWGYTEVKLTTHELGGLTKNDFIWAAKLDRLLS